MLISCPLLDWNWGTGQNWLIKPHRMDSSSPRGVLPKTRQKKLRQAKATYPQHIVLCLTFLYHLPTPIDILFVYTIGALRQTLLEVTAE